MWMHVRNACVSLKRSAAAVLSESAALCVTDRWPAERQIIGYISISLTGWTEELRGFEGYRARRRSAPSIEVSQWGTLSESAALDWTPLLGSAAHNLDRVCQIERTQENWTGMCVCVWRRAAVSQSVLKASRGAALGRSSSVRHILWELFQLFRESILNMAQTAGTYPHVTDERLLRDETGRHSLLENAGDAEMFLQYPAL